MLGVILRRTSARLKRDFVTERCFAVAAFASRLLLSSLCGTIFTHLPSGKSFNPFIGAGISLRPMLSRVKTRNLSN